MDALSSDLTSIANQASSSRAPAYLKVLKSLLARPASELPADQLQRCLSAYLDQAVFSDTNSTGGNLVVGRQVLSDFDLAVVEAGASSQGEGGEDATMGQNDPAIKDEEVRRTVFEDALEKVQPRVISFEEQVSFSNFLDKGLLSMAYARLTNRAGIIVAAAPLGPPRGVRRLAQGRPRAPSNPP